MHSANSTSHPESERLNKPASLIERLPSSVQIRNVGIATDFSPCSDLATQHALVVARRFGAAVHFLHAVSRSEFALVPDLMIELDDLAERDADQMLHRMQELGELNSVETYCWNMDGEIPEACADLTRDHSVDLLVLGTHGRSGLSKFLFGSTAQRICRETNCPVLTVGPWSRTAAKQVVLKKLLLVTDASRESIASIPYALTAAITWHVDVDVLYVRPSVYRDRQTRFEDFGRQIDDLAKAGSPVSIHYHTAIGNLSHCVLDFASQRNEDLIVLGLNLEQSIYSTQDACEAYEIIRMATCPVLSVRLAAL